MHRRPVMRIALSTLALLGGLGVAAGATGTAQADTKPQQPASAGLLTALQKDFHLTAR
ncbi:S1 family peptidase, partial [Streptomyces sp. SID11233]|nr:S1 family peptidase [Streptomyces sp. SID11233]